MGYSSVTLYRENVQKEKLVVIYYKHISTLRESTTVYVKSKDFDKKAERVRQSDEDHERKNRIIARVHSDIEHIIDTYMYEHRIKPDGAYVKKQLQLNSDSIRLKSDAELTEYYQQFLTEKALFFKNPDRSIQSLKDYKSTYNALMDYQKVTGSIPLNAINSNEWLERFNQFLANDRPRIVNYIFLTKKQSSKTRHKRFSCLKGFGKWLVLNGHLTNFNVLNSYGIRVVGNDHYALTLAEMKLIHQTTFSKETHQKAIDLFLFACHTGLRISDVRSVKKSMVKTKSGRRFLELVTKKTKADVEIPLSQFAEQILVKYDYNLRLYSEVNTNKYIHEALSTLDEFNEYYVYGADNEDAPKYQLITFHTGRRTFITNLVNNNVNLNAIMKMTGHKKLSTLQEYINPNYELISENIKVFNDLTNG